MLQLIEKIKCVKEQYTDYQDTDRITYKFYFVLNNGYVIRFEPYYSNFQDESKNFNTFGDIYKFLVDEIFVNDKREKKAPKKNEK